MICGRAARHRIRSGALLSCRRGCAPTSTGPPTRAADIPMVSLPKWLGFLQRGGKEGTMSEVTPETPAETPAEPDNGGEDAEPETEEEAEQ